MDPDSSSTPDPEIVSAANYVTGVIPLARPGVVVWLGDDCPDADELARARAMRAHPAGGRDDDTGHDRRHLRAVS